MTQTRAAEVTVRPLEPALALARELAGAWGSWGPNMTPDAQRVAFISDRRGTPELWVQDVVVEGPIPAPVPIVFTPDPVIAVRWSADGRWLACAVATDGGVRTQVWVVRPDGTDALRLAGSHEEHAELGPWTRSGHKVVVTVPGVWAGEPTRSFLVDPATGERELLAVGRLIHVLDLSVEERLVLLEDGQRGHQFVVVVDRVADRDHPLLPYPATGSTEVAIVRPSPPGDDAPVVAYLATDAGLPRRQLVAMPLGPDGWRGQAGVLAARDDAELEALDADDAGRLLLLVWNVAGRSEIELLDTTTDERIPVRGIPGQVVYTPVLSRDGHAVILAVEGPTRPRELWRLDTATHGWTPVTDVPALPDAPLVTPTLETFTAFDGLPLTGWLYRVPGREGPGPAVVHLHGGPEAQERPTFSPQHQALVAAGFAVLAPNIRGSSGFGRAFVHADDVHGRYGAFDDVVRCAEVLVELGVAPASALAVTGRSYGGYLTLASLAFSPHLFAAGVDICGMSDLRTFYRDTEPWIGAAAVTKYGHPEHNRELLDAISPLRCVENIVVPLLVVHGEHDTNVPIGEAHQVVAALRGLGRDVEYLELAGEGHEYRRAASRALLLETMLRFLDRVLGPHGGP
jgi:dipeptidyl aminopeptidase/acylaminoacyl peptidase